MLEVHPFKKFVPKGAKYLLLGSFIGKITKENNFDWFYGSKYNQFWPIIRSVYNLPLKNRSEKERLLENLKLAITDIIYSCSRKRGSNLDSNLTDITYNTKIITRILESNKIERIYFTSRFVERQFHKKFKSLVSMYPDIKYFTLPSPSPRYAVINLKEKIKKYKKLLSE